MLFIQSTTIKIYMIITAARKNALVNLQTNRLFFDFSLQTFFLIKFAGLNSHQVQLGYNGRTLKNKSLGFREEFAC